MGNSQLGYMYMYMYVISTIHKYNCTCTKPELIPDRSSVFNNTSFQLHVSGSRGYMYI